MKHVKQQQIEALLVYYQNRVKLLSDKKLQLLKNIIKQSDNIKVTKLKNDIEKLKYEIT